MCLHDFRRGPDQQGNYNSAAHESLRAVGRCVRLHFGHERHDRLANAVNALGADYISELSESQANMARKFLESVLP